MLVREVMSSPAITVRRTDPVRRAIRLLYQHDISSAPVLDAQNRLVGIVSELDLLCGEFEPDPRAHARPVQPLTGPPPRLVEDVMTPDPVTATETTDITAVVNLMVGKRFKSLPVMRGDCVVGVVSRRDLLTMLVRTDEDLRVEVEAVLREVYPFGPSWHVDVTDGVAVLSGAPHEYADQIADVLARTVPGIVRVRHLRNSGSL
ncbi:CBS domain-containing protein [Nonomuraea sp. NPDC050536]|uniref:CBS domain-containing protein n=1 Tax=Nonomuraea sp. NPDC050536 TaxID=3364366 RepID=UPI0037C90AFF